MKLWKLMADQRPGISGMDLKNMMINVADGCGVPGMTTRTVLRNTTQIAFIIADNRVTAKDLYDAWRFECKVRTGNESDPAGIVTMISKDAEAEVLAAHYGMTEDEAQAMLNEAYPVAISKEEADRHGVKNIKVKVEIQGAEKAITHLRELCKLMENAQALATGLNEMLSSSKDR